MIYDVAKVRQQWEALTLELLIPAPLTNEQLTSIGMMRADKPEERELANSRLPVDVAHYKDEEAFLTCKWMEACHYTKTPTNHYVPQNAYHRKLYRTFRHDIGKVHRTLFDIPRVEPLSIDYEIGLHDSMPRQFEIHADGNAGQIIYAGRISALPMEVIDGKWIRNKAEWHMMKELANREIVGSQEIKGSNIRQNLRAQGILREVPLNTIVLMSCGEETGTLHCSGPVPPGGAYSGFLRSHFLVPNAYA